MPSFKLLKDISSSYIGTPAKWKEFLYLWEQKRASLQLPESQNNGFIWSKDFDPINVENKILKTQERLGLILPQSYKDFIVATDGCHMPNWLLNGTYSDYLWPVEKIDLLKNVSPHIVYEDYAVDPDIVIGDEEYYHYDRKQNSESYRQEYLEYCLKLNEPEQSWEYEILLNPKEQTLDGEMEAWFFYTGGGSVLRYTSFAALIVGLYLLDVTQIDAVRVLTNNDDPYGFSDLLLSSK